VPAHQCKLSGRGFDDAGLSLLVGVRETELAKFPWGILGGLFPLGLSLDGQKICCGCLDAASERFLC
jgi:hypothetical protein